MSLSLRSVFEGVEDFILNPDYERKPIIQSNFITPFICLCHYVVTTYAGPHFMKNRKPYNLKYAIIAYNALLVSLNFCVLYGYSTRSRGLLADSLCPENPEERCSMIAQVLMPYTWLFVLLKYVELLDSVFFIMRKRFDLLSVLHRLHHATTPIMCAFFLRNPQSLCLLFTVACNSAIHVIMYFYYALAACGPNFRKYLWWKKYLTSLQIIQLIGNMACVSINAVTGCHRTGIPEFALLWLCGFFVILFLNYFIRQLIKNAKDAGIKKN